MSGMKQASMLAEQSQAENMAVLSLSFRNAITVNYPLLEFAGHRLLPYDTLSYAIHTQN